MLQAFMREHPRCPPGIALKACRSDSAKADEAAVLFLCMHREQVLKLARRRHGAAHDPCLALPRPRSYMPASQASREHVRGSGNSNLWGTSDPA